MVKVETFGTRQKKVCFGCGSMISFENDDIEIGENKTYVVCPVCGKNIKAFKIDRQNPQKKESEVGRKAREALEAIEQSTDWDEE